MLRNLTWAWIVASFALATARAGQNVVVVLDDSSSMNIRMRSDLSTSKMEAAKQALLGVVQTLPPEAKVGIVLLNGRWKPDEWAYPLAPVDTPKLKQAVQQIRAHGATPLGACTKAGADALLALRAKDYYGSYRLLIVTDGEATDRTLLERYLPDILSRGLWVDVIGVDMAADHSLATKVHTYRRADDPEALEKAIADVFAESTGDRGDADESDFELIAALPDEVASAALEALAQSGNQPIGQKPPLAGTAQQPRPRTAPPFPQIPATQGPKAAPVIGLVCCLVGVLVVVMAVVGLILGSKRRR